jgi:hypothetical protein
MTTRIFISENQLAADTNPAAYRKEKERVQYFRCFAVSIVKTAYHKCWRA